MNTAEKINLVNETLTELGCQPSFPPTNQINLAEGADGDSLCPFRELHTKGSEDDRSLRVWVNREDPNRPENGPRIFCSCRHTSCQDRVWAELTTPLRRKAGGRTLTGSSIPNPKAKPVTQEDTKKADAALAGKTFVDSILNDPATLHASEEEIMKMSPIPIRPGSAERNVFSQIHMFLSLFPQESNIWLGNPENANTPGSIRKTKEWMEYFTNMMTSPACQEEQHMWPFPGNFATGSTFKTPTNGRNNANLETRLFTVCESDKLGKKEQLRVIKALLSDKRFPIAYVLFSGSKSYHIGIRSKNPSELELAYLTGIPGSQAPRSYIKTKTPERFAGMGFDPATVRESQPCRMPGPINPKTGKMQRLLYINPAFGYDS